MSKYSQHPLDFAGLRTVGLRERGGKVKAADFATPYRQGSGIGGWLDSLPHILAGDSFRAVVAALAEARAKRRAIIWGLGGHVIKCGLAPILLDLMRRGYVTSFATNGSAAIHDFEIALAGHTSEDVEAVLPDGRFGAAEETGRDMNLAISAGDRDELGIGEALGRWLDGATGLQNGDVSFLLQAYRNSTPVTVHVALGTDTPHTHPAADWARDRRRLAARFPLVRGLRGRIERRRCLSQCGLRRRHARGIPEGRLRGPQPGTPIGWFYHREFRFPAALPPACERCRAAARWCRWGRLCHHRPP